MQALSSVLPRTGNDCARMPSHSISCVSILKHMLKSYFSIFYDYSGKISMIENFMTLSNMSQWKAEIKTVLIFA